MDTKSQQQRVEKVFFPLFHVILQQQESPCYLITPDKGHQIPDKINDSLHLEGQLPRESGTSGYLELYVTVFNKVIGSDPKCAFHLLSRGNLLEFDKKNNTIRIRKSLLDEAPLLLNTLEQKKNQAYDIASRMYHDIIVKRLVEKAEAVLSATRFDEDIDRAVSEYFDKKHGAWKA